MPTELPESQGLTREQIEKWAHEISEGRDAFPGAISAADRDKLATAVRKHHRTQLLRLIARTIAQRLLERHRGDASRSDRC